MAMLASFSSAASIGAAPLISSQRTAPTRQQRPLRVVSMAPLRDTSASETSAGAQVGVSACAALLSAALLLSPAPAVAATAVAVLNGSAGVTGTVTFTQDGSAATQVVAQVSGLAPGLHGFHVHKLGDLSGGCMSTGPHFNPAGRTHGAPGDEERHAGDLGNLLANDEGVAVLTASDLQIPLSGSNSILGRAVVVHAEVDDLGKGGVELSKATGNAGGRVACGVIGVAS